MIDVKEIRPTPRFIRTGECNRCGACCTDCKDADRSSEMVVCTIYEDRPRCCKEFPEMPPIQFNTCGYRFIDRWDNNRVLEVGEA
jgi:hypothetical protein